MEVGLKIREIRKKAKLTQIELAKRAGIGLRFIRELENNKQTVRMDKVNQILEFFGYHFEVVKNERP